jgi:hypothetical protein
MMDGDFSGIDISLNQLAPAIIHLTVFNELAHDVALLSFQDSSFLWTRSILLSLKVADIR